MGASILLVGSPDFQAALLILVRPLPALTVEVAHNALEAMDLVQAQQPDMLLIEFTQPDSLELCRQMKAQRRLAWMYCLVIDDRPLLLNADQATLAPGSPDVPEAEALETGADAYLRLPPSGVSDPDRAASLSHQLLLAQMQAGLRRVQNYRELMRANDLLSAIALTDPLTELNNRRAFERELPRQVQNARSRHQPFSLIMLDVDHFKQINDTYGHLVGDRALVLLATRLRQNLRFYDTPFRYGGEEFVIILGHTDELEAVMIANRLGQLMREQPFQIDETLSLDITISAGTATLTLEDDETGTSLLERADRRLLQAKATGRDRVVGGLGAE